MTEIPQTVPLQLIERVRNEGRVEISLTAGDIHAIFAQQAENDRSDDLPVLLPGFKVEINQGILHLRAPYTIDEDKKPLTFVGTARNNDKGVLTDNTGVTVIPETLKGRVLEAFECKLLDLPHFVKLIIEDALGGEATVEKLFVDGDNLGVVLKRNSKLEGLEDEKINGYTLGKLDRQTAEKYAKDLARLADQIPLVPYREEEILAESKGERKFFGKWEHSLVVFDGSKPIGLVIGYERQSEGNEQYPENTLYVSELAVDKEYQRRGIARQLLKSFFDYNTQLGFKHLEGDLNFSVQTNSADWNRHVQNLYASFGFAQRATKQYPNRVDVILGWKPKSQKPK